MDFKNGDRVKVKFEGTIINSGSTSYSYTDIAIDNFHTINTIPIVFCTKLQDPEPMWIPGDVIKIQGIPYMYHQKLDNKTAFWSDSQGYGLPAKNITKYWNFGEVTIIYKHDE